MTDMDIEVGRRDAEITFSELNVDISFTVTLEQFLDTLEHILDDTDVSAMITKYIARQAQNAYDDEKVFNDLIELDRFIKQLEKVME